MNDMITDDDFPADGDWPGARILINLAGLSGVAPERARAHRQSEGNR
jgi:hypothetical protein